MEAANHARAAADRSIRLFNHVVRADAPAMSRGIFGQKVGRRLAEVVRNGLVSASLHLLGDVLGLVQGRFPEVHGEDHLQCGRRRPFAVARRAYSIKIVRWGWNDVLLGPSLIPSPPTMPQDPASCAGLVVYEAQHRC